MTTDSDDLTAGEGVNEGSADSTTESAAQGAADTSDNGGAGVTGALAAASETGRPAEEYDPAPPLEAGLPMTTTGRDDQVGPGQQLEADEG